MDIARFGDVSFDPSPQRIQMPLAFNIHNVARGLLYVAVKKSNPLNRRNIPRRNWIGRLLCGRYDISPTAAAEQVMKIYIRTAHGTESSYLDLHTFSQSTCSVVFVLCVMQVGVITLSVRTPGNGEGPSGNSFSAFGS